MKHVNSLPILYIYYRTILLSRLLSSLFDIKQVIQTWEFIIFKPDTLP